MTKEVWCQLKIDEMICAHNFCFGERGEADFASNSMKVHGREGLLRTGHFLLCSEDVGKRDFPADLPRVPQTSQPHV
jgi:hypothetical protein